MKSLLSSILVFAISATASADCIDLSGTYLRGDYKNGQELIYKRLDCSNLEMHLRAFNGGKEIASDTYIWKTDSVYRRYDSLTNKDQNVFDFGYYTADSLIQSFVVITTSDSVISHVFETRITLDSSLNLVSTEVEKDEKGNVVGQSVTIGKRVN